MIAREWNWRISRSIRICRVWPSPVCGRSLGPYPVVLEQQARWIAYGWGGAIPSPGQGELRRWLEDCVEEDHHGDYRLQHEMSVRFGMLCGTDPSEVSDPELGEILAKSAVTGEMFRIVGIDSTPDAEIQLRRDFWTYGPPEVRREIACRFGRDENGNCSAAAAGHPVHSDR